eukprot:355181-Chlamydomonas_euryale.AAC.2
MEATGLSLCSGGVWGPSDRARGPTAAVLRTAPRQTRARGRSCTAVAAAEIRCLHPILERSGDREAGPAPFPSLPVHRCLPRGHLNPTQRSRSASRRRPTPDDPPEQAGAAAAARIATMCTVDKVRGTGGHAVRPGRRRRPRAPNLRFLPVNLSTVGPCSYWHAAPGRGPGSYTAQACVHTPSPAHVRAYVRHCARRTTWTPLTPRAPWILESRGRRGVRDGGRSLAVRRAAWGWAPGPKRRPREDREANPNPRPPGLSGASRGSKDGVLCR